MSTLSFLVRHADAGDRATWQGDDRRRPISPRGVTQALWLVSQLAARDPTRLASSPYVRCVQTLEPLAQALGREVVPDAGLAEGAGPSRALALLRESGVVVCTHGDVIEEALDALRARGLKIDGGEGIKKGAYWIVEDARVRYVPPPR